MLSIVVSLPALRFCQEGEILLCSKLPLTSSAVIFKTDDCFAEALLRLHTSDQNTFVSVD